MTNDRDRWNDIALGEATDRQGRPLRRGGLPRYSPTERERQRAIQRAWDTLRETGDDTALIELGLYPPKRT